MVTQSTDNDGPKTSYYILKESILDFRYVRLYHIDIPKEKWLNYLQIVEILIRRRVQRHLISVSLFASYPFKGFQSSMG